MTACVCFAMGAAQEKGDIAGQGNDDFMSGQGRRFGSFFLAFARLSGILKNVRLCADLIMIKGAQSMYEVLLTGQTASVWK